MDITYNLRNRTRGQVQPPFEELPNTGLLDTPDANGGVAQNFGSSAIAATACAQPSQPLAAGGAEPGKAATPLESVHRRTPPGARERRLSMLEPLQGLRGLLRSKQTFQLRKLLQPTPSATSATARESRSP